MQIERIKIDGIDGFLVTVDGEKSAITDGNALLNRIKTGFTGGQGAGEEVSESESNNLDVSGYRFKECEKFTWNNMPTHVAGKTLYQILNGSIHIMRTGYADSAVWALTDDMKHMGTLSSDEFNNAISGMNPTKQYIIKGFMHDVDVSKFNGVQGIPPQVLTPPQECIHQETEDYQETEETDNVNDPLNHEEPLPCPVCGSENTSKCGGRETLSGRTQKRVCKNCKSHYTDRKGYGFKKKYSLEIVNEAIQLKGKMSHRSVAEYLEKKYGMKVSYATIGYWYKTRIPKSSTIIEGKPEIITKETPLQITTEETEQVCPMCDGTDTIKNSTDPDGVLRSWCLTCNRSYRADVGGKPPENTICPVCSSEDCMCWGKPGGKYKNKLKYYCKSCKKFFSREILKINKQPDTEPEPEIKTETEPVIIPEKPLEPDVKKRHSETAVELIKSQKEIILLAKESISITGKVNFSQIVKKTGLNVDDVNHILTKAWREIKTEIEKYEESRYESKVNTDTKVIGKDWGNSR